MITSVQLGRIFLPEGLPNSRLALYTKMKNNYQELKPLGHNLWLKPINYLADLVVIHDHMDSFFNKQAIIELVFFLRLIPVFNANNLDKSLESWSEYLSKDFSAYINSNKVLVADVEIVKNNPATDFDQLRREIDNLLHFYIMILRSIMAEKIIEESKHNRPQVVVKHSHPIWKIYYAEDINAGAIGDGRDLQTHKSLISSNDISGLLLKLKSIYMKAAYLQLIQTLSLLAERKSYQTITFRQDELKEVLAQIKKLSDDTFKQLKIEDTLISKMCYNIIKIVDPKADMVKVMDELSLDIGNSPSYNYSIINRSYN